MPEKKEWWFMELIEEKLKTVASYHGVIVNVRLDEARLPTAARPSARSWSIRAA